MREHAFDRDDMFRRQDAESARASCQSSTEQKAAGWDAVCDAMEQNGIQWYLNAGNGIESMVTAINNLAQSTKEPTK